MSKTLRVLITGLLAVGCGKHAPPTNDTSGDASGRGKTVESTPTTTAKPVKELTAEEKVVGTYDDYDEGKRYLKPFSLEQQETVRVTRQNSQMVGIRRGLFS